MTDKDELDTNRQDTMQRIQVGVVGLVAILLLVSVANFVIQRASDQQTAVEEIQAEADTDLPASATAEEEAPAEPLAELGITPAAEPEEEESEVLEPAAGIPGQTVPDLKPDPNLEAPMDREPQ